MKGWQEVDSCDWRDRVFPSSMRGIATVGDRSLGSVILIISGLLLSQQRPGVGMAPAR